MTTFAKAMEQEFLKKESGYRRAVQAYLTLILTELMRMSKVNEEEAVPDEVNNEMNVKAFTVIDSFFGLNYHREPTSEELARLLSVSRRQLHRIMIKYFGLSFREKLVQVRIDVAKGLLANTELPVEEVAERSGYEYASSLCKAFHHNLGVTPQEYRRKYREEDLVL